MGLFDDANDRFDPSSTDFILYSELEAEEDEEMFDDDFSDDFDGDFD